MAVTEAQALRVVRRADVTWASEVKDPRCPWNQKHEHHGMLALLSASFACGMVQLRRVEDLSVDLGPRARRRFGLRGPVSDTALWNLVARQSPAGFRETLQQQVRELIDSKAITKDFAVGVVSIDGKSTWKSTQSEVPGAKTSLEEKSGVVTASFLSLSAVLTSSSVRPCLDLEMIGAKTGESPAFRELFPRVVEKFGGQFEVVTVDAGMTCRENAAAVLAHGKHYLMALKGNQPQLYQQAQDAFLGAPGPARAHTGEVRGGERLFRELHTIAVTPEEVNFPGAVEMWRVVQRSTGGTNDTRYFLSSRPSSSLSPTEKLGLVRMHWGIENNHHWTKDVALEEDDIQPCQASRDAIEVVAWLRVIAYNLLATWRTHQPKKDRRPISWDRAMEILRDALIFAVPERAATLQ